jgi:hydrogenase-4 component F
VIIRYYIITAHAVGPEFPQLLLLILGGLSIAVSAFIIVVQHDFKRKLAYHSVEHLGLIALGLGIGGPLGVGAALLHVINHSFTKALLFCGSGNVLIKFGTRDLRSVKGVLRVAPYSGLLIMGGALALAGLPPFNIFVSEFLVFMAGLKAGYYWLMLACALLFTVTVAALVEIIAGSVLGKCSDQVPKGDLGFGVLAPMAVLFVLVLVMGVAIPQPVSRLVQTASTIVTGQPGAQAIAAPWQATDLLASVFPHRNDPPPVALAATPSGSRETNR